MLKATGEGAVLMLGVSVIASCQMMQLVWLVTTASILPPTMSSLDRARRVCQMSATSTWKTQGKRESAATVDALLTITVGAIV